MLLTSFPMAVFPAIPLFIGFETNTAVTILIIVLVVFYVMGIVLSLVEPQEQLSGIFSAGHYSGIFLTPQVLQ